VLAVVDVLDVTSRMKSGWDSWVESELGEATDGCGRIEVVDVDVLLGTADGAVGAFENGDEEPPFALEDTGDDAALRAVDDPGQAERMLGAAR
jgi:hypothetical protein